MRGKIRTLIRGRGFGFISAGDGRDVFFHRTGLEGTHFSLLEEGNNVEFNVESGSKSFRAVNIRIMQNLPHESYCNTTTEGNVRFDPIERQFVDLSSQLRGILERLDKIDERLEQIERTSGVQST